MFLSKNIRALAALSALLALANGHSWPENINTIDDTGAITSNAGWPRSWELRTAPGWNDSDSTTRIIDISDNPDVCRSSQRQRGNSPGLPPLKASPNSLVAIQYLENGHVTQPDLPPGHPPHTGTLFIYGSQDVVSPTINEMLAWTDDGKGGDGKGRLITSAPFDDGRCYQVNPRSPIYQERVKQFPNHNAELPCQIDFAVPSDASIGSPYSIFWFWNWTIVANNDNPHLQELYTSCIDFDIQAPPSGQQSPKFSYNSALPVATAALPWEFSSIAVAELAASVPADAPQKAVSSAVAATAITSPPMSVPTPSGAPLEEGSSGGAVIVPSADATPADAPVMPSASVSALPSTATVVASASSSDTLPGSAAISTGKPSILPFTASLPSTPVSSSAPSASVSATFLSVTNTVASSSPVAANTVASSLSTAASATGLSSTSVSAAPVPPTNDGPLNVNFQMPSDAAVVEIATMRDANGAVLTIITTELPRASGLPAPSFTITVGGVASMASSGLQHSSATASMTQLAATPTTLIQSTSDGSSTPGSDASTIATETSSNSAAAVSSTVTVSTPTTTEPTSEPVPTTTSLALIPSASSVEVAESSTAPASSSVVMPTSSAAVAGNPTNAIATSSEPTVATSSFEKTTRESTSAGSTSAILSTSSLLTNGLTGTATSTDTVIPSSSAEGVRAPVPAVPSSSPISASTSTVVAGTLTTTAVTSETVTSTLSVEETSGPATVHTTSLAPLTSNAAVTSNPATAETSSSISPMSSAVVTSIPETPTTTAKPTTPASTSLASSSVAPSPMASSPVASSPVASSPVAPTSAAPTPPAAPATPSKATPSTPPAAAQSTAATLLPPPPPAAVHSSTAAAPASPSPPPPPPAVHSTPAATAPPSPQTTNTYPSIPFASAAGPPPTMARPSDATYVSLYFPSGTADIVQRDYQPALVTSSPTPAPTLPATTLATLVRPLADADRTDFTSPSSVLADSGVPTHAGPVRRSNKSRLFGRHRRELA